jgi:hypothetical protein
MSTWTILPVEILCIIFDYLNNKDNKHDILQCGLVSENWKLTAQHALFSNVSLNNNQ